MNNELIYLDTNIYIDYFENRVDKLRPLGEFAYNLIKKSLDCEYKIIISSLVLTELEFNGYRDRINELIKELQDLGKLIFVKLSERDEIKAKQLVEDRNTPLNDTKHAVIANRLQAMFLVTRNMKDYEDLQHLIVLRYPENL